MGWAERSGRRKPAPKELTGARCAEIARAIRDGLAGLGVRLQPHHDLERIVRQAELLASLGVGDVFGSFRDADGPEKDRITGAILAMEQAERVAASLQVAGRVRNFAQVTKWLQKKIDRLETQESRAQDHLFEIEMAGRLARYPDLAVSFEEPDIVVRVNGKPVYLPCKRPRRVESVGENIRDARHQLAGRQGPSVILINTEAIFHRSGNPNVPVVLYDVGTPDEARAIGVNLIDQAIRNGSDQTEKAFRDGVTGILYCGAMVFLTRDPRAYQNLILHRRVWNSADPGADGLTAQVARLLYGDPD